MKNFDKVISDHSLMPDNALKQRNRKFNLSQSEVMTILVLFHYGSFKNLKYFHLFYVQKHTTNEFPNTVSYNRFVELQKKSIMPLAIFMKTCALGKCTDISYINSTPLIACHIKREKLHKTFKGIAQKGQCSLGWFFGFKLHLIINDKGEILDFVITQGNVDDRKPLKDMSLHKKHIW